MNQNSLEVLYKYKPAIILRMMGGEAVGMIEAKKLGTTLSGVKEQNIRYLVDLSQRVRQIRLCAAPCGCSRMRRLM